MDDGLAGPFRSILGFNTQSLLTYTVNEGVIKGRQHRFRYRARNIIGSGPWSDNSAILAATVPIQPGRPLFKDFIGTLLYIIIQPSPDAGGSSIQKYELWVDQGDDYFSEFRKINGYAGIELEYAVSPLDNLVRGRSYRFKTRALNQIGFSDFSDIGYIADGDVPDAPD